MDAKSNKKTWKAAALAAGLVAVLLPTGCAVGVPSTPVDVGGAVAPAEAVK